MYIYTGVRSYEGPVSPYIYIYNSVIGGGGRHTLERIAKFVLVGPSIYTLLKSTPNRSITYGLC